MGSVQKVSNGGTIIVRSGVLAGIGPVGPKGAKGDPGPQGVGGSEGPAGPAGFVAEAISVRKVGEPQPIGSGQSIDVAYVSIEQDDAGLFTSSTIITPDAIGATFQLNAFVEFSQPANAGDGSRELWLLEDGDDDEVLQRVCVPAAAVGSTFLGLSAAFVAKPNAVYRLRASHTDDLSVAISSGRCTVNRIGAGQPGPVGPAGPQGPVGPVGPQGVKGDDGDANSGFTSFDELG